mgnify:CR=1 FL=1
MPDDQNQVQNPTPEEKALPTSPQEPTEPANEILNGLSPADKLLEYQNQ